MNFACFISVDGNKFIFNGKGNLPSSSCSGYIELAPLSNGSFPCSSSVDWGFGFTSEYSASDASSTMFCTAYSSVFSVGFVSQESIISQDVLPPVLPPQIIDSDLFVVITGFLLVSFITGHIIGRIVKVMGRS